MGHAFNEFVVSTIRLAIPVISAVMGAFYGSNRAGKAGGRQLTNVAAFAGLGWLGGYVLRSALLYVVEGSRRPLPAATAQSFPPPPVEPSSPSMTAAPTAGLPPAVDPYSFTMSAPGQPGNVDIGGGAPPPRANNDGVSYGPPTQAPPKKGRRNKTLTASAYGQLYGN